MLRLVVENFSCIEHADIEIGRLTVLIGPQASGKSVISKLTNFCVRILSDHINSIENETSIGKYKKRITSDFGVWFPRSAWGSKDFQISFEAAQFSVSFKRDSSDSAHNSELVIQFSEAFERNFQELAEQWKITRSQFKSDTADEERSLSRELEAFWQFQNIAQRELVVNFGDEYIESQLFIPAGRAFFTSVGKSIALLEQGAALDPVTAQFGRLYSRLRDGRFSIFQQELDLHSLKSSSLDELMIKFFGGKIKFLKDQEFIEYSDGRRVPFSALSSGQQELMPLWLATRRLLRFEDSSDVVYIEEPEAHLFPSAQASLTQYLASFVARPTNKRRLFVTTHSPYVLASLNNLIKAGALSAERPEEFKIELEKIVSRDAWLAKGTVKAYALKNGSASSIIDDDGFIDTDYLDEISNEVANVYSSLLDLEYPE